MSELIISAEEPLNLSQIELLWLKQDRKEDVLLAPVAPSPNQFIPMGVNAKCAYGLNSSMADSHKNHLMEMENIQFAQFWMCSMMRCRHKKQYEVIMKRFLTMVENDPSLKPAANLILRSTELITHRDGLQESRNPDEPMGLNMDEFMIREPATHCMAFTHPEVDPTPSPDTYPVEVLMNPIHKRNPRKRIWKTVKTLHILQNTIPATYVGEDDFMVAYYVNKHTICVVLSNVVTQYHLHSENPGLLDCAMNYNYMVVSDGNCAYMLERSTGKFIGAHKLEENLCISSIGISNEGDLLLGSSRGHIFRILGSEIRLHVMLRDYLPILDLHYNKEGNLVARAIGQINLVDSLGDLQITTQPPRIASSCLSNHFMGTLLKNGTIQIFPIMMRNTKIEIPPPKDVTCQCHYPMPWYKGGLWMNGRVLHILYMDGLVRKIKV